MKTHSLALAALAALLASCGGPYNAVSLTNVCFPPTPADGGTCVVSATCDATLASTAELDVAVAPQAFQLSVQFDNQLPSSTDTGNGQVNVNDAFVREVELRYAGANLAPVTLPVQVTVLSGGQSVEVLPLIPTSYYATLAALLPTSASSLQLVISVRATGVYGNAAGFTTAWFQIPVIVYNGSGFFPVDPCAAQGKVLTGWCPQPGQTATFKCE
jgi:hypothetical protein